MRSKEGLHSCTGRDGCHRINSSLGKIDWYYLLSSEPAQTTTRTITLMLSRQLPDYDIMVLTTADENLGYIRGSIVMPMRLFLSIQKATVFDVNSVNAQHYIDVKYVSDTQLSIITNQNGYRLWVFGIKFK